MEAFILRAIGRAKRWLHLEAEVYAQIIEKQVAEHSLTHIEVVEQVHGEIRTRGYVAGYGGRVKAKDVRGPYKSKSKLLEDLKAKEAALKKRRQSLKKAARKYTFMEIYSIKLPGNPKVGEGKPKNQNHAIIFTRGNAVQTIDMNQDNYFEEALKMRNLLEEFNCDHGILPPTILGVREHVFIGSVSSLASFMSNQESSFVTLGQ